MAREYTFPEEVVLVDFDPDTGSEMRYTSYAEVASVFMSETYAAMAVGLRPDLRVILPSYDDDYHGEQRLELHEVPYRIERAYRADDGTAELTVTRLKGGGVIPGVGY